MESLVGERKVFQVNKLIELRGVGDKGLEEGESKYGGMVKKVSAEVDEYPGILCVSPSLSSFCPLSPLL